MCKRRHFAPVCKKSDDDLLTRHTFAKLRHTMISSLRFNLCKRAPVLKRFPQCQYLSTIEGTATRPESQVASSLLQIGTRRIFEHEHDQYRELVRRFYEKKVIPFHSKWEEVGHVPRELWTEAGAEGLLCVTVPPEFGGMGLDVRYAAVHWEEQSYANTTGPGFFLHSEIVAPYLMHYGTQEQKEHYLPDLCAGTKIGAIAMTEPGVSVCYFMFWYYLSIIPL